MPIPRSRLDESTRPLKDRILDVLRADPENAYSMLELRAKLERKPLDIVMFDYAFTKPAWPQEYLKELEALVKAHKIVVGRVNDTDYYGAKSRGDT